MRLVALVGMLFEKGSFRALALTDLATSLDLDPVFQACLHALSGPSRAIVLFDHDGARRFTSHNLADVFGHTDAPPAFEAFHTHWGPSADWSIELDRPPRPISWFLENAKKEDVLWMRVLRETEPDRIVRAHLRVLRLEGAVHGVLATYERTQRSSLELVLERLPMGVIFAPRSETPVANEAALRLLDVETLRQDPCPMCAYDTQGELLCGPDASVQEMLEVLHDAHLSTVFLRRDEDKETEARVIVRAHDLDASVRLLILEDVTTSHRREKKRDEILSIASHELRNPLTPLKGLLQIARQQREHTGRVDGSLLQKAESQVSRIARLLDGLMDLSRLETGRMTGARERTNLSALVRECVEIWAERHPAGRMTLELGDETLFANLYTPGIEQVLMNLLDNALKYSPADTPVAVALSRQGGHARLTIMDQGRGIEESVLERVFERFFQGPRPPRQPSSLGLGLYISQKIIQEHAGTIEIDSQPGSGTSVTLLLALS